MTNHIDGRGSALILVSLLPPLPTAWAQPAPLPKPHPPSTYNMGDQSGSSRFQVIFDSALRDYETQTGTTLTNHPFAQQLQVCQTVESTTALLQEQAHAFKEFRESDKIMKSLKGVVLFLSSVSATARLGRHSGLVCLRLPIGCSTSLIPI